MAHPLSSAACAPCRIANRHRASGIFSAPVNARRTVLRAGGKLAALERMKRAWQLRSAMALDGRRSPQHGLPSSAPGAASPVRLSPQQQQVSDPMAAGASSAEPAAQGACAGNATTVRAPAPPPGNASEAAEPDEQPPACARHEVLLPACLSNPRHDRAQHADAQLPLHPRNRELDSLQPFAWDKCAPEHDVQRDLVGCCAGDVSTQSALWEDVQAARGASAKLGPFVMRQCVWCSRAAAVSSY